MSLRLTHYGTDVLLATSLVLCPLAILSGVYFLPLLPVIIFLWLGVLFFFRSPVRRPPAGKLLLAPADGKVVAVEQVELYGPLTGRLWRIDIFLSVFDVHVNRAPCAGTVASVTHRPGEFLNALRPEASVRNESNEVLLRTPAGVPVLVRQVAGVIARRIVCDCVPGDQLDSGETFGMIKFGSRTELYIPVDSVLELKVRTGQKVKAGLSILGDLR
jgi:phosphatidylserine decarboxylase